MGWPGNGDWVEEEKGDGMTRGRDDAKRREVRI